MRERTYVWLKIASDDLDAAEHCLQGEKLLWAMFMCQQAVEKALKAVIFEKTGQTPPRKHDLISLAGDAGLLPGLDQEAKKFLRRLTYYYIETRYPDKRVELEARCTNQLVRETLRSAKEVLLWLKKELN